MTGRENLVSRVMALPATEKRALLASLMERRQGMFKTAPLSYAQQRLWFLDQLVPGNPFYNESSPVRCLFQLDVALLERSLNEVVRRHEALRTCFVSRDGEPEQRVLASLHVEVPVLDFTGLPVLEREAAAAACAHEQARTPFDLTTGPLLRIVVLKLAPADQIIVLTMHHIICDGWSMGVFVEELGALYEAYASGRPSPLAELSVQYTDFAIWQRDWLQGERLVQQLEHWKSRLQDLQTLDLPVDRPRPEIPSFVGARERIAIPPPVAMALRELCEREGVTPFMALLAAFQVTLSHHTGQDDIAVGSPVANRCRPELEKLIGFFVNALVLRTSVAGNPSFREVLQRVREVALSAYAHQDLPFERLVEELHPERDLSRNPLFQVTFQYLNRTARSDADGLLRIVDMELLTSKFDLRCDLWPEGDAIGGQMEYSVDLFDAPTVQAMCRRYQATVAAMVQTPDMRIGDLRLLSRSEERAVVEQWNQTAAEYPWRGCVHERFCTSARSHPERLAVAEGSTSVTYAELDRRSDHLAAALERQGIRPGCLVAILLERSIDLVTAVLAVLKVGAAYVPLDVSGPAERVAGMVRAALVPLVLTRDRYRSQLPAFVPALDVEAAVAEGARFSGAARVDAQSLVYVIFTSGSTGVPRGVEVTHGSLCNLVDWHIAAYRATLADRATFYASPGFDASVWEIWPYLSVGASLHVVDDSIRISPEGLAAWFATERISIAFLPTPVAESFVTAAPHSMPEFRLLLTGGDKLRSAPVRKLPFRFVNHYGPTENTVVATAGDVVCGTPGAPTMGWPIANVRTYVLDRSRRPVPVGVKGELFIAGSALARGYLGDSEQTRERFIVDPFDARPGARMYRSGDRVRQRRDGSLEFHGRVDAQIKLRGFRVEPSEIEAALDGHPAVGKSLVSLHAGVDGQSSLVAMLTPADSRPDPTRVDAWRSIYEQLYGTGAGARERDFDIVGWNSSYSGEPLAAQEMREQVDATVERIARLGAARVLEIGCGTGLLLLRLAGHCQRYVGSDFAAQALEPLGQTVQERGWEHVELWQRAADDFSGIEPASFDAVVLNSVVQYFPDIDYLVAVLRGAMRAVGPQGAVFIGDVRHLGLLRLLHAGIELARGAASTSVGELRERIARRLHQEQELVVEPAFFEAMGQELEACGGITIELKRGHHDNELTRFRYDAVLWGRDRVRACPAVRQEPWSAIGSPQALRERLGERLPLAVRGMPSARLVKAWRELEAIERAEAALPVSRLELTGGLEGIEPEAIWGLAEALQYDIQLSGAASGEPQSVDLLCVPREPGAGATWWSWDTASAQTRPWSSYANAVSPLGTPERLTEALRQHLRAKLPEYMIPTRFVWIDALPLTANGKLDRQALPAPSQTARQANTLATPPGNDVDCEIAQIWQDVLGLDRVGINENFFDLGGHSLLLVRVHSRLKQRFGTVLSLVDLYRLPTVSDLAAFVAGQRGPRPPVQAAIEDTASTT